MTNSATTKFSKEQLHAISMKYRVTPKGYIYSVNRKRPIKGSKHPAFTENVFKVHSKALNKTFLYMASELKEVLGHF